MPFNKSPETEALKTASASYMETSRAAALSLLGATPFLLTFSDNGDLFIWPDESDLCVLLRAPAARIPHNQNDFHDLMELSAQHARQGAIRDLLWDGDQYKLTYQITAFDGSIRWIEERGERIAGTQNQPTHIQGVMADVTHARKNAIHTALNVNQDTLTGLWNRTRFVEALEYSLSSASLRHNSGFVICLNVSNFEDIRETAGADAGEVIIKDIAAYLKRAVSAPFKAARIGKASFGLLLPGCTQTDAQTKIGKHISVFQGEPRGHMFDGVKIEVALSGLPLTPTRTSASDLLSLLESQVQPAGADGEFSVKVDTPPQIQDTYTVNDIRAALDERRISVAYQPIVYASTRDVHHYECLLRLTTKTGDMISAARMIMAAEQLGQVHLLDQRALEIAVLTLRQNPDIDLAVNVSAGTIGNEFALQNYLNTLKALGPDARRITVELTETLRVEDLGTADDFATRIKSMGCRFAIDDFGQGHTSFQTLARLNADTIKIDGSMVKGLAEAPHKQAFIRMMVDLANTTGVETVAEMVSTEADADMMEALGVTYFQSYIFGMPSPEPVVQRQSA